MIKVQLSKDLVALIDDSDLALVGPYTWFASGASGREYASRHISRTLGGGMVLMHRHVLGLTNPMVQVDHINGDRLDNRRANLRVATQSQNQANERISRNNTSGFKGVTFHRTRGVWVAALWISRRRIHLGSYASVIAAASAYDDAALQHFGEFARLNFPKEMS